MLVVEQNAALALGIAQRGYVLEAGSDRGDRARPTSSPATTTSATRTWGSRSTAMTLFLSQLMNGIGQGVVYASLALALVLIYRTTGILNFAQGEMALFSTYVMFWWFTERGLPVWSVDPRVDGALVRRRRRSSSASSCVRSSARRRS